MAGSLDIVGSDGLWVRPRDAAARRSYIDLTLTAEWVGFMVGFSSLLAAMFVDIDLRPSRFGRPILEQWSLTNALGGV